MTRSEKILSDVRVGIVSFLGILCLVAGITFAGGNKGLLFQKTLTLKANLHDVNGLKSGSTVTMGGMSIGKVSRVTFLENSPENLIEVIMAVRMDVIPRLKEDSIPSVRTQGMLGDRYIDISMGSPEAAPLDITKPLAGTLTTNFDETLHEARSTLSETTKMLEAINSHEGTAGKIIYDQKLYQRLIDVTTQVSELLTDFKQHPKKYVNLEIF